jgi:hypothetical protein
MADVVFQIHFFLFYSISAPTVYIEYFMAVVRYSLAPPSGQV